jgi:hypothetical protein
MMYNNSGENANLEQASGYCDAITLISTDGAVQIVRKEYPSISAKPASTEGEAASNAVELQKHSIGKLVVKWCAASLVELFRICHTMLMENNEAQWDKEKRGPSSRSKMHQNE